MADKEFDIHRALANASRQMAAPNALADRDTRGGR